jgi:hypothetical protein
VEVNVLFVVHGLHGGIGASIVREANKAKSSAAARIAVLDDNLW